MKRQISLFLVCLLVCSSLAVPVKADEFSNNVGFNILDYATVDDTGSNYFTFSSSRQISLSLPITYFVDYVDIIFSVVGATPTSVQSVRHDISNDLTVVKIGGHYWRAYGSIRPEAIKTLYLNFSTGSSSTSYYQILRANLYYEDTHYTSEADCFISAFGMVDNIHFKSTDIINDRPLPVITNFANAGYTLAVTCSDWRKYDYLDYFFTLNVDSITAVSCGFNDVSVPFTVSYLDNDPMTVNSFYFNIRLDLRGLDRESDGMPVVQISGNTYSNGTPGHVYFNGCSGFLETQRTSPDMAWYYVINQTLANGFNSVKTWISDHSAIVTGMLEDLMTSVVTNFNLLRSDISDRFTWLKNWINNQTATLEAAIRGDTAPGDDFQLEVNDKDAELEDMSAVMNSVHKPALDSINVNVNQYVSPADISVLTSPLLVFLTGDIFGPIIIMTILLATVSYVLYGKR